MSRFATCAAAVALCLRGAAPADACSPIYNEAHELDQAYADDTTPPSAVTGTAEVSRFSARATCPDRAAISLRVAATDDTAPAEHLGYLVRGLSGAPPAKLVLRGAALRLFGEYLEFPFDPDYDSSWHLVLEVSAVDLNGNIGPPTSFEVSEGSGCDSSGGGSGSLVGLVVLGLVARRRPRRGAATAFRS